MRAVADGVRVCVPPVVSYFALLSSIHLLSPIRLRECIGRCRVTSAVNKLGLSVRHNDLGLLDKLGWAGNAVSEARNPTNE